MFGDYLRLVGRLGDLGDLGDDQTPIVVCGVLGAIAGAAVLFVYAGIGGAIVGPDLGWVAGSVGFIFLRIFISFFLVVVVPAAVVLGAVGLCIWLIAKLWGVGRIA